VAVAWS